MFVCVCCIWLLRWYGVEWCWSCVSFSLFGWYVLCLCLVVELEIEDIVYNIEVLFEGKVSSNVKIVQVVYWFEVVMFIIYRYIRNGRIQIWGMMVVNVIFFQIFDKYVMFSIVYIVRNVVGIVSKLVMMMLKLRF